MTLNSVLRPFGALALLCLAACGEADSETPATAFNPDTAAVVSVDRFQDKFATLFKRSAPAFDPTNVSKVVPAANAPIDLDKFLVKAFGPLGERVTYYSLDIVPPKPVTAFLFVGADGKAIANQLPVIDAVPGDDGYTDFVRVTEVKVGAEFVANQVNSKAGVDALIASGKATATVTTRVENFSVVPKGTTASLKFKGRVMTGHRAWYREQVAHFLLIDDDLTLAADGSVPTSPIHVIFKNDMSPAMGFAAESDGQTHNIVATLPGQPGYSSYWDHTVGNLSGFDTVKTLVAAQANVKAKAPVIVNCPVVAP